jgi:hypothetical protein
MFCPSRRGARLPMTVLALALSNYGPLGTAVPPMGYPAQGQYSGTLP